MILAVAVDTMNATAMPNVRYDCMELCSQSPAMAKLMGHGAEIDQPPGVFLDLGPWTKRLELRRCPTEELGDRSDIQPYLEHHECIEAGLSHSDPAFWPEPLWESYWLLRREHAESRTYLNNLAREKARPRAVSGHA